MINAAIEIILVFTLILDLQAVTVVNHHPEDEYILDHQVLYDDAIAEAKRIQLYPGPVPGCKPCTNSEMNYCNDGSVINDHCCCDGSYNKVFQFVEHTCRVGPEECKVLAGDCAEYTRLRECCCHSYLAAVWKQLANSGRSNIETNTTKFLVILIVSKILLLRLA